MLAAKRAVVQKREFKRLYAGGTLPAMTTYRPLPDPNGSLYESRDFILGSRLARRAFAGSGEHFTNFICDLLDATHRLSQSCNLPEFTDHGLPHLCSLIDRVSQWQSAGSPSERYIVDNLSADHARLLLVAVLIHDLGMLSQKPEDLPDGHSTALDPSQWSDTASWVRRTHVVRLPKLLSRVMKTYHTAYSQMLSNSASGTLKPAVEIAMAHQRWPWEWEGDWAAQLEHRGLAAIVSVADLLDEDSARCDTETLLEHRGGDELNRAHWIRHVLTTNRVQVLNGEISIYMCRPPKTGRAFKPVFSALRNHFRLVLLYEEDLRHVDAAITTVHLVPSTGIPTMEGHGLEGWRHLEGYANEHGFAFQLLRTFMPESLKDNRKLNPTTLEKLRPASLEDVDISILEKAEMRSEPRTSIEQTFEALVGG